MPLSMRLFHPVPMLLALLFVPGAGTVARAQPTPFACTQGSNMDMRGCTDDAFRVADAQMNAAYRRVQQTIQNTNGMSDADREAWLDALRMAQRAWMAFRDADCGAPIQYQYGGGTGGPLASLDCILDKTTRRTRELTDRYLRP